MSYRDVTARAWMDGDGVHVWVAHDCKASRVETMLPNPPWHAADGRVVPSVICKDCGLHAMITIEAPSKEAPK